MKKQQHTRLFALVFLLYSIWGWGQTTVTITLSNSGITQNGYNSGAERTWTLNNLGFGGKAVMKGNSTIQLQKDNGVIYNTTALPGRIISIRVLKETTSSDFTLYGGSISRLVNNTDGDYSISGGTLESTFTNSDFTSANLTSKNYTFFAIKKGGTGTGNISSIEITYASPTVVAPSLSNQSFVGITNTPFSSTPSNSGGTVDTWEVTQGALPSGLTLNSTTGQISGTPTSIGTSLVVIKASNNTGSDTKNYSFIISSSCFNENFNSIITGDNTTTNGNSNSWNGNSNFPIINTAYQAGGAIKIGSSSNPGSVTSKTLTTIGGTVTVSFDVKGWTTVEGDIKVTMGSQNQTVTYTAKMADSFENKSVTFNNVPLGSTLKIETTSKRAFIDNVSISCGTLATTWDATNSWTNGIPDATKKAIIDGTYNGAGFVAKDVTVNSGKSLTIASGSLETPAVVNNGSITVKDGANFIHNAYSGTGSFSLEKTTTSDAGKYVFWSSPVAGQNMYKLYSSASSPFVMTYNTATDYYDTVADPTTGAFGIGYSVKVPANNAPATFTGTPNLGAQSVTLINTANANGNAYNLIGNPYTSNLDLVNFYLENLTKVGETFYFWVPNVGDNTQNGATATVNPGWAVYNANTTTWSRAASGSNSIIRPGQGFIVKGLTTSASFKNEMRTSSNTDVSFFNKNTNSTNEGKYWLQLMLPNQSAYQMAVTYSAGASNAYDAYDSKMMSVGNDALYSLAEGNKLAIQGRAPFVATDIVTLGNKHAQNGSYTISLVGKTGIFDNGQSIYIKDKQLGSTTELTAQGYTFTSATGEFANRFDIVYQPQGSLATVETTKESLRVYRSGDVFVIENTAKIDKVMVYDASGRVVKTLSPNANKAIVDGLERGMYLFNITSQGKEQTKKIVK